MRGCAPSCSRRSIRSRATSAAATSAFDERALVADAREDGAVVVDVDVHVEQPRVRREGRADRVDRRPVAPLGEVRHGLERKHGPYCRPVTRRRTTYRSLASLERDLRGCRACVEAGYPLESLPVLAPLHGQRAYLFGQAPGIREGEERRPWRGRAGQTLRRWLDLDEETFYATFHCASVTRCYPGRPASGRGDRTPTPEEQRLCSFWRDQELAHHPAARSSSPSAGSPPARCSASAASPRRSAHGSSSRTARSRSRSRIRRAPAAGSTCPRTGSSSRRRASSSAPSFVTSKPVRSLER